MTNATKRPRRQKKGDRLLSPGARRDEIETDHAVAPFDRMATRMDVRWGIDRLPSLVSPELAARYGAALAYLNECIAENDPAKTAAAVNNCLRGMEAMDAEATKLGQPQASGDYWEYDLDGFKFGVLKDGAEWRTAQAARPDLKFYTMREIGVALKAVSLDNPMFAEIKKSFPKSEVTKIKPTTPLEVELDDVIPF